MVYIKQKKSNVYIGCILILLEKLILCVCMSARMVTKQLITIIFGRERLVILFSIVLYYFNIIAENMN